MKKQSSAKIWVYRPYQLIFYHRRLGRECAKVVAHSGKVRYALACKTPLFSLKNAYGDMTQ